MWPVGIMSVFIGNLHFYKTVGFIVLTGGVLTHPYRVRVLKAGVIGIVKNSKEQITVPVGLYGRTHPAGHQSRECRDEECGEREI